MSSKIFITEDGSHSIFSEKHGVSYHSKYGAIQETQHVFIEAALSHRLPADEISILEIGFGTGLNAYMTFLEAEKIQTKINYTAIEAYPVSIDEANVFNYSDQLNQSKDSFLQFHSSNWEEKHSFSDYFLFEKKQMRFEDLDFQDEFDVIYFDAFAPNAQPELWEENILQKMFDALQPKGVLTTYCAKGVVKRTFKKVGFKIEAIPGPPGKREMTRAIKK